VGEAVEGGGRDEDRMGMLPAEHGRAQVALGDVHEDARADRDAPPRGLVVPESELVARPARVVAERPLVERGRGGGLEVGEGERQRHACRNLPA
jgi:hypothetical protein